MSGKPPNTGQTGKKLRTDKWTYLLVAIHYVVDMNRCGCAFCFRFHPPKSSAALVIALVKKLDAKHSSIALINETPITIVVLHRRDYVYYGGC